MCFGWPVSGKRNVLHEIFPCSTPHDKSKNHFPAGVATSALNAFVPAPGAHLPEYLQKRKFKREVNKGEVVEGSEWIVISQTAKREKTDNSATKLMSWICSAPRLSWARSCFGHFLSLTKAADEWRVGKWGAGQHLPALLDILVSVGPAVWA